MIEINRLRCLQRLKNRRDNEIKQYRDEELDMR